MKRFIKIDYDNNYSSICDSEEEVINGCGYDVEEITFEDLLEEVKGLYEIIEINGDCDVRWLNECDDEGDNECDDECDDEDDE
jgi:hypothetical protein